METSNPSNETINTLANSRNGEEDKIPEELESLEEVWQFKENRIPKSKTINREKYSFFEDESVVVENLGERRSRTVIKGEKFTLLQKWEGIVEEVNGQHFKAKLVDLTENKESDAEATIGYDEIDEEDKVLLKEGAVFYWSVGYLDRAMGRIKASQIRFRRLPQLSEKQMAGDKIKAEHLHKFLNEKKSKKFETK